VVELVDSQYRSTKKGIKQRKEEESTANLIFQKRKGVDVAGDQTGKGFGIHTPGIKCPDAEIGPDKKEEVGAKTKTDDLYYFRFYFSDSKEGNKQNREQKTAPGKEKDAGVAQEQVGGS